MKTECPEGHRWPKRFLNKNAISCSSKPHAAMHSQNNCVLQCFGFPYSSLPHLFPLFEERYKIRSEVSKPQNIISKSSRNSPIGSRGFLSPCVGWEFCPWEALQNDSGRPCQCQRRQNKTI